MLFVPLSIRTSAQRPGALYFPLPPNLSSPSHPSGQAFISTGRGAREALPDSAAVGVVDAMRPLLRKGRYDEAVEQAVVDIGLGLAGRGGESEGSVDW